MPPLLRSRREGPVLCLRIAPVPMPRTLPPLISGMKSCPISGGQTICRNVAGVRVALLLPDLTGNPDSLAGVNVASGVKHERRCRLLWNSTGSEGDQARA
jgi:hypothetical protein